MSTTSNTSAVPMTWNHATTDVADPAAHTGGGVLHVNGDILATHPQQHLRIPDASDFQQYADWAASHGYRYFDVTPYSSVTAWIAAYPSFVLSTTLPVISQTQSPISPLVPAGTTQQQPQQQQPVVPPQTPLRLSANATTALLQQLAAAMPSQQQQQQQQPSTATATSPNVQMDIITALLSHITTQQPTSTPQEKKPTQTMPKWDGKDASVPMFLSKLTLYKKDPFFKAVDDWTQTKPAYEDESRYLLRQLLETIPDDYSHHFLSKAKYSDDGVVALQDYIELINPSNPQNLLKTALDWANLEMGPQETGQAFMARVRALSARLSNCSLEQFVYLLTLARLDPHRYQGILLRYRQGDPSLLNGDVQMLSDAVNTEDTLSQITDPSMLGVPSANRAGGSDPPSSDQDKSPPSSSDPDKPPPKNQSYPYGPMRWKDFRSTLKDQKICVLCFQRRTPTSAHVFCGGCPTAAAEGYVLIKDEAKAMAIRNKFKEQFKSSDQKPVEQASGKRATSAERPPTSSDTSPTTPTTANRPSGPQSVECSGIGGLG
eukprot:scaffold20035_cov83-Skeletonema_dohrnii-CCMP3373.AAC.1